jgi:twinkle protein
MEIHAGRKFGKPETQERYVNPAAFMSEEEHRAAYAFVCKHFYFINPPETQFTVDGIIAIADKVYNEFFKFDGFVLDPYNEIEHRRPAGMNETDYVSTVIQKFRNQNRRWNSHFWFVAHPTKPNKLSVRYSATDLTDADRKPVYQRITLFDISGSAHWKSKCDFGIIVHRDMNDNSAPSVIEVEKVRFRENGMRGEAGLYYDYLNNRFVQHYGDLLYGKL